MFKTLCLNNVAYLGSQLCRHLHRTPQHRQLSYSANAFRNFGNLTHCVKAQHGPYAVSSNVIDQSTTLLSQTQSCQPWVNGQVVRGLPTRNCYRPSAQKRIHKHGIHKRIQTEAGIEVLWRRFLKGRHNLAVYEDFRPLLKQFQKPKPKVKW